MKLRALGFDLDGTLYPAAALNLRAAGLFIHHPALFAAFAKLRRDLRLLARTEAYRRDAPAKGIEFRAMEASVLAKMTGRPEAETKRLLESIFYGDVFECFSRIEPTGGVREALHSFRSWNLPLGLLSDMPPWRKLELMGMDGLFDAILCSEDSGYLKPEPESFLDLARALDRYPDEILYVGNNPRYDLAGARAVGMMTAIVSRRRIRGADLSFHRWSDLVAFVRNKM